MHAAAMHHTHSTHVAEQWHTLPVDSTGITPGKYRLLHAMHCTALDVLGCSCNVSAGQRRNAGRKAAADCAHAEEAHLSLL